jgi:drug/metabolite transporter (DMT)-like permease
VVVNKTRGVFLLLGGTVCLSTIPIVSKLVLEEIPHVHFTAWWMLSAGVWAAIWAFGFKGEEARNAIVNAWPRIILTGVFSTGYAFFYFAGLSRLNPAVATFLVNSRMVWAIAIGMIFLGERYSAGQIVAMLIVASGVVVVYIDAPPGGEIVGMILVILSAISFVLMSTVAKSTVRSFGVPAVLLGRFVFPTLALLPVSLAAGSILPYLTTRTLILIVGGSFIGPFFSFLLIFTALRYLDVGVHTIFHTLNIVLTTALTYFVFGTIPAANRMAGGAMVLLGIAILGFLSIRAGRGKAAPTPEPEPSSAAD